MSTSEKRPTIDAVRFVDYHRNGSGNGVSFYTVYFIYEKSLMTAVRLNHGEGTATDQKAFADVIKLSAPTYLKDKRATIIEADAFEWQPPKGKRYNAVWHDIWDEISSDNFPEMTKLVRKYSRRAEWQGCWGRDVARSVVRRERRSYW